MFVNHVKDVPDGSVLVFSAHGVSRSIRLEVSQRNLIIFDATCPLVSKVHSEVLHFSNHGVETILVGHAGHPEIEGIMGQYSNILGGIYLVESVGDVWLLQVKNPNKLSYVTQTTLSVDDTLKIVTALRNKFPLIKGPRKNDICYATINRQEAVRNLAYETDLIFVIGSRNSSNSSRLAELVRCMIGKKVYLIDNSDDIQESWVKDADTIGVTAGASTPNVLINQVINKLHEFCKKNFVVEEMSGRKEYMIFKIPKILKS